MPLVYWLAFFAPLAWVVGWLAVLDVLEHFGIYFEEGPS